MHRLKLAALRYAMPTTQLEVSLLAVAVFSSLIALTLGVHYATIE